MKGILTSSVTATLRVTKVITRSPSQFYLWLYYRCYRHSLKRDGKFARPWLNASLYVVMLLYLNLVVLLWAVGYLFRTNFGIPVGLPHWMIGMAFVAIVLLQHLYLWHGGRYEKIIRQFSKESTEQQRRGDLVFDWYVALSFLAFIVTGVIVVVRIGLE